MFCRNCGVNIPDDSVFCYKCGVPVLTSESEDGVKQKEENNGSELQATIQKLQPLIDPITETEETQNRYVYPAAEQQPKEKKKNIEQQIGVNIMPKIGAILLILGVIGFGKDIFMSLSDSVKMMLLFLLGGSVTGAGIFLHRKKSSKLATGLMAGGVAVLFATIAVGYLAFSVFSPTVTFIFLAGMAITTVGLSVLTNEELICIMGTVGGYLPLAAMRSEIPAGSVNIMCGYFTFFSLLTFFCDRKQKWNISKWIALACHLIAMSSMNYYIVTEKGSALTVAIFTIVSFAIYMGIPLTNVIFEKLSTDDPIFLSYITLKYSVLLNFAFRSVFDAGDSPWQTRNFVTQIVFMIMALLHIVFLYFNRKRKRNIILEYISSVFAAVFLVLSPAFINDSVFSLNDLPGFIGILIAGILVIAAGGFFELPAFEIVGTIALISILFSENNWLIILAVVGIWASVIWRMCRKRKDVLHELIKCAGVIYIGVFVVILGNAICDKYAPNHIFNLSSLLIYLPVVAVSWILIIPKFKSNITEKLFVACGFVNVLIATVVLCDSKISYDVNSVQFIDWVLTILSIILASVMLYRSISFVQKEKDTAVAFALSVAAAAVILPIVLAEQIDLQLDSVLISVIYGVLAVVVLAIGFRFKNRKIRIAGLILSLCVAAKLCFIDTHSLDRAYKVMAYFAFAFIFYGIAMVYTKTIYKKKDDVDEELPHGFDEQPEIPDAQQENIPADPQMEFPAENVNEEVLIQNSQIK